MLLEYVNIENISSLLSKGVIKFLLRLKEVIHGFKLLHELPLFTV